MTLWGGRFTNRPSDLMWEFTTDTSDRRLLVVDIEGSIAHTDMLGEVGVLSSAEAAELIHGLGSILDEAEKGSFAFLPDDEDVHSAVERRLIELVGDLGRKLHTGRSRNDQVALDLRLYLHRAGQERRLQVERLIEVIAQRAAETADVVVSSYTHLQQAQAVPLGHHLLAYAWMLHRDGERLGDALTRIGVSPLGAGAGAGSTLPLDPELTAAKVGFLVAFENSIDAVAARDFVAEYAFCSAQLMTHLSRLAADLVLWASREFDWISLPDSLATGSSALPQKRNPDMAELVRGRAARVIGDVTALLSLQKGLPLAYNRDLQEDKAAVFDADDATAAALAAMTEMIGAVDFHPPGPGAETAALDLAEALVARGVPFRTAHEAVGELIVRLEGDGLSLNEVDAEALQKPPFHPEDLVVLAPGASLRRRSSRGAATPADVHRQVAALREAMSGSPSPPPAVRGDA